MPGPAEKNPSSNTPFLETSVWFPEMPSLGRMASRLAKAEALPRMRRRTQDEEKQGCWQSRFTTTGQRAHALQCLLHWGACVNQVSTVAVSAVAVP
jgi:hypothetical protein